MVVIGNRSIKYKYIILFILLAKALFTVIISKYHIMYICPYCINKLPLFNWLMPFIPRGGTWVTYLHSSSNSVVLIINSMHLENQCVGLLTYNFERWVTQLVCRWRIPPTMWINVNCILPWTSTSWTRIAVTGYTVTTPDRTLAFRLLQ